MVFTHMYIHMVFTTVRFLELAMEGYPVCDLNA